MYGCELREKERERERERERSREWRTRGEHGWKSGDGVFTRKP